MKKLGILIVFVFMMASFTSAQAEAREGAFSFGLSAGGYFFENNQDLQDSVTLGLRAGYNFTENLGSEIFINWVPSKYEGGTEDEKNKVYVAGIEGLYHFMPKSSLVPYLAIGIGAIHYTSDDSSLVPSKLTVDYGAGLKYFIAEDLAMRADVRHVLPLGEKSEYGDNPHNVHNDLLATLGFSYYFGGDKKKIIEARVEEPPAPKKAIGDADMDGVLDNVDKCPGTPAGVTVDKIGCPFDTDKDGVTDNLDQCPGTPSNLTVNKYGCPVDSDNDGVADYLDKCPSTSAGVAIDKDGCPIDSDTDKDGVSDYLDKCPNTPAGETVEKDGCVHTNYSIALKVEFDTGKSVIKKKYHEEIRTTAVFMKKHPEATATIVGHTDNVGDPDKNMALSEERAKSVRQYLIDEFGIDGSRITAIGNGSEKPIAGNDTAEGRQKNRRIVAIFHAVLKK